MAGALLTLLALTAPAVLLAETLVNGCGHMVVNEDGGTLTSENYPGTYPNYTQCIKTIKVPPGKGLYLKLADLDFESQDCDSAFFKIYKGSSSEEIASYCGNLNPPAKELYLDTNEATIHFESKIHISGRGFLINFASTDHPDMITCLARSNHYRETDFTRYCPAGCREIAGEIYGDVAEGYRDTSLLCKAAVHAGVIADELGGRIHITHYKGASRYTGVQANGILSKVGSLSDRRFVFNSLDCSSSLTAGHGDEKYSATSSWERSSKDGEMKVWSPEKAQLNTPGMSWASSHASDREWLEINLGDKRRITGIVTTGSTLPSFNFFVKSYVISFKREVDSKWRIYKGTFSNEEKVLQGNSNYQDLTRNNLIPPVVARAIRIIPRTWNERIALKVELMGCNLSQTHNSSTHPMWKSPTEKRPKTPRKEEKNITEPVPSEENDFGWKLIVVLISVVLVLFLIVIGICICITRRNRLKADSYNSEDQKSGCWKQLEQPFMRQQSTEFTISYAGDKEEVQKFDFVKCDTEDYQQPPMIGTGMVTRKGSTFKPMDKEVGNGNQQEIHYDCPLRTNEYALPLTYPEPEYATPIIERHVMRDHTFSPECVYNVPVVSLDRQHSFSAVSFSVSSSAENSGGDYQTPHSIHIEECEYDRPKVHNNWVTADSGDYQKPQYCTLAAEGYSSPRDCLKPRNQTAVTALL